MYNYGFPNSYFSFPKSVLLGQDPLQVLINKLFDSINLLDRFDIFGAHALITIREISLYCHWDYGSYPRNYIISGWRNKIEG